MNNTKEKILLLLLGGLAFGCSYTPGKQWRVLKTISKEWKKMDKKELRLGVNNLYKFKFVEKIENGDGSTKVILTEKGKWKALNYQLKNIKNKKEAWDGKWRMVSFDIPQIYRKGRDALRHKLKEIGFCELQKSVFITPFNCKEEIKLLVKFFELNKYVCFGVLEYLDNAEYFKKVFKL